MRTCAVIPCYRTTTTAALVAKKCLEFVDLVVCVDDCCPDRTGDCIESLINDERLKVIRHQRNKGVGGATKSAIRYAIDMNVDIIVKLDSDGQMDPDLIPDLMMPLLDGKADMCKGNRFTDLDVVVSMPLVRLLGNTCLSFLTKISTGYWELFDPTNGFLALTIKTANRIQLDKLDDRYGFETDLLFRCGIHDLVIAEMPMKAIYADEVSSLNPYREVYRLAIRHVTIGFKRILYQYIILDFNPGSLSMLLGLAFGTVAFMVGIRSLVKGVLTGVPTPLGTQTIFLACFIIAVNLIIAFVFYDSTQRPLVRRIKRL